MKTGADVDAGPLAFALVLLVFFLFLGTTIGGPLSGLSVFFLLLFLFDIVQVFWTNQRIRESETYSTDHPVKGESLTYNHYLETGPWLFRSCRMDLHYHFPKLEERSYTEKRTIWLGGKARFNVSVNCGFRHRGAYTIGLREFVLRSWSGWLRYRLSVWEKVFYVRPRVIELKRFPFLTAKEGAETTQSLPLLNADPAVFERVDPYRDGMPLRGVDFRPLARGLPPVVRVFLPEPWAKVNLYLDTFRSPETDPDTDDIALDREDVMIEAAASLSRFLVQHGIPVEIFTPGQQREIWDMHTLADCEAWEVASVQFLFRETLSLSEVWHLQEGNSNAVSGIFLSLRPDEALWEFLERAEGVRRLVQIVKGWDDELLETWVNRRASLERAGVRTLELRETDDLLHAEAYDAY